MSITVQCPQCNKGYRVPDDKAGKRMKCKEFDAMVPIPATDDEFRNEFDEFDDPQPRARRKSAGSKPSPRRGRSKTKKKSSSFASPVQLVSGGVIIVATVGIVLFILNQRGVVDDGKGANKDGEKTNEALVDNTGMGNKSAENRLPNKTNANNTPIQTKTTVFNPVPKPKIKKVELSGEIKIKPTTTIVESSPDLLSFPGSFYRLTISENGKPVSKLDGQLSGENRKYTRAVSGGPTKILIKELKLEEGRQAVFATKLRLISLAF